MNAFIKFNKGMLNMPLPWKLWLMLLIFVNMIVPFFYLNHLEAQMVLLAFFASFTLTVILTKLSGFSRLLGLGHFFWIPMLIFLGTRLAEIDANDFFGIWIRLLMVLNTISLVIDGIDVGRYITGDRAETVTAL